MNVFGVASTRGFSRCFIEPTTSFKRSSTETCTELSVSRNRATIIYEYKDTVSEYGRAYVANSFLPDWRLTLIMVRANLAHSRVLTRNEVKKQNARSLIRLIMPTRKHRGKSRCDRTLQ